MTIWVTLTRPIIKPRILPYPGFPICRVLPHPSPGPPTTPHLLQIGSVLGLEESVLFDPLGDPVPPVFLQQSLIFFNQHSQREFYPPSWLPLHVLLPHTNLQAVGLDDPVVKIIRNDHALTLGCLGLIRA
jgi:hypothetical protein